MSPGTHLNTEMVVRTGSKTEERIVASPEDVNGMPEAPLLQELEKGPWPSFVKEIKSAAQTNEMSADLPTPRRLRTRSRVRGFSMCRFYPL